MAFLDYNGLTHYNDNLNAKFNTKANVDGAYEGMTVGNAEQLISSVYTEDSVPYLFRTSGGSADIGDREFDEIVGGTLAWNQLYTHEGVNTNTLLGITYTNNNDGTWTINGTATAIVVYKLNANSFALMSGHKYLLSGCAKDGGAQSYGLELRNADDNITLYATDNGNGVVVSISNDVASCNITARIANGATINNVKYIPQLFDLTQIFGSTIADYIYSLEQSHAGDGVAFFRKFFNKPYYAYNSGELISSLPTAHETVGFNAWDEEWEVGAYDPSTGEKVANPSAWRSTNYIPVVPNTAYYFMSNFAIGGASVARVWWYDADKNFITMNQGWNRTYTSPTNAYYCTFRIEGTHSDSNQICINLSWDGERDGEYEPYVKHTYPISEVAMHGIWKLDANNKVYCDGDIRKADGTLERRYGIVDLGTLTWDSNDSAIAGKRRFVASVTNSVASDTTNGINTFISNGLPVLANGGTFAGTTDGYTIASNGNVYIFVDSLSEGTSAGFKTAMNGVYLVYKLAEPTTETVDTFASPQIVDDFGTEEYVDTRAVPIPVGHNTKYTQNLRAKVEMSPDSPADNGDYLLRHANGENEYVPYIDRIPSAPSENGTYVLKCTVSGSTISYTWVAE